MQPTIETAGQTDSLDNLTPFGAASAFGYHPDGRAMLILCVAGRFALPPAGRAQLHDTPLGLCDEQPPPPWVDVHFAAAAHSSLRQPGQAVVFRPGTDVYLQGSARAHHGQPVSELLTRIQVGPLHKEVLVLGTRHWSRRLGTLRQTAAAPFAEQLLRYEYSYGGTIHDSQGRIVRQEARNPVGRGLYLSREQAVDAPLPSLESPTQRISAWDSPAVPVGYGPIPASWQPRLAMGGTFDEQWARSRIPYWPQDLLPSFFCAAPADMVVREFLHGGELIVLHGFSAQGAYGFRLPRYRLQSKSFYPHRTLRALMQLDGVLLEPDEGCLTLYWRRSVPLEHGSKLHLHSTVRLLEPWEEAPA